MTKVTCKAWKLCKVSTEVVFVKVYREVTCIRQRPCLYEVDGGQV